MLSEAVQRVVDAENREQALRSELEQTKAQLAAAEDRIRTILQSWEKFEADYTRLLNQAYQDCQRAHGGPRRCHIASRRPYTIPWYDRVKKTD